MSTIIAEKNETSAAAVAFKPEVREVADVLKSATTYDTNTGVGTITPDTYVKLLQERTSLTEANVKDLQKFNTTFVAAAHLANGEAGLPVLQKNKGIDTVELRIPMVGRDAFEVTLHRSKEVSAGNRDNPAERKTNYGVSRGGFEIHAEGNRGELSKVKQFLQAEAATLFS